MVYAVSFFDQHDNGAEILVAVAATVEGARRIVADELRDVPRWSTDEGGILVAPAPGGRYEVTPHALEA